MSTFRPLICLDFDGVLHSYTTPWTNAWTIPDPPVPGAIEWLMNSRKQFELAILSSRSKSLRGRWAMKRWLRYHLGEFMWKGDNWDTLGDVALTRPWTGADCDEMIAEFCGRIVREIRWPWFKPAAFLTIDDRALCFDGQWPELNRIAAFKPWNKRGPAA